MKRGARFVFDSHRFSLVYLDFASMHLPPGLENPEGLHRSSISLTEGGYYKLYCEVMCLSSRRISAEGRPLRQVIILRVAPARPHGIHFHRGLILTVY